MANQLIRGGSVLDGSGAPARSADVRVRNGKIVEIAPNLAADGEPVLDASGAFVTPGFIDTHTHFDGALFWDPHCSPMPQHGITSILIGNCALGLAPLKPRDRKRFMDLFSYIEDIPQAAFETALVWDWESYDEYAAVM